MEKINSDDVDFLIKIMQQIRHEIKEVRLIMEDHSARLHESEKEAASLRDWVDRIENVV